MSQIDIYLKSYHLPHPQTSATYVAKSWDLMPPSATANYRPSLILLLKSLRVKFSQINTLQKLLSAQRQQQPGDPGGRLKKHSGRRALPRLHWQPGKTQGNGETEPGPTNL